MIEQIYTNLRDVTPEERSAALSHLQQKLPHAAHEILTLKLEEYDAIPSI